MVLPFRVYLILASLIVGVNLVPAAEVTVEYGDPIVISTNGSASTAYQLQSLESLESGIWNNIETERAVDLPASLSWEIPQPQLPAFYRLLQRPMLGAKVLQVAPSATSGGNQVEVTGLLSSDGFDFMALTVDTDNRHTFFRPAGGDYVQVFKNPTFSDPLIILFFGDYSISYRNLIMPDNIAMVSITGPSLSVSNKYVELGPLPGTASGFAKLSASTLNEDEPDLEQQVKDEYIIPILSDLQRFSLNLIPVLGDLDASDLAELIEQGWLDINRFVNNWTNGVTEVYEADGVITDYNPVLDQARNPYGLRQVDGPQFFLDEQRDRLDATADITRQEADLIQDIKNTEGVVVSEQRYFVRGRVVDYIANFGQPVAGVEIYLFAGPDQTTGSNSNGEFGFLIGPGDYTIEARKPGVGFTYSTSQPFSVEEVIKNPANYTNQGKLIHIEVYQSSYLQADLEVISITPQRKFVGVGETIWFDYQVRNNGSGPNSCDGANQFIFTTDYQCMVGGSCSISGSAGSQNVIIQPGETGTFRSFLTIPSNWVPGEKIYTGGAIYDNCQSPKTFYSPVVLAVICDGNFDTLPASLVGYTLNFNWEETTGQIDPGQSTDYTFNIDGTVTARDSDSGALELSPSSYQYVRNGDTATITFTFNNTTGGQTVTGSSVFDIVLEGPCGGSFAGDVQYTINQGGFITNLNASGTGFFLIK